MPSWLEDIVGALQSGYSPNMRGSIFPDVPQPPPPQPDEAVALAAAGEAGGAPFSLAPLGYRRAPDVNSAGIQLAIDNAPPGTGVPGPLGEGPVSPAERAMMASVGRGPGNIVAGKPDGSVFGGVPDLSQFSMTTIGSPVPPSLALAKAETAQPDQPPMAGPIPMPQPRPPGADAATDVSARAKGQDFSNILPPNAGPAPMSLAGPQAAPQAPPERPFADKIAALGPAMLAIGGALQGDNTFAAAQMKRREDQALQAQQGNATARLLAAKGASPAEIQAAVAGGPDTVKALLGQYLGKDKFQVVQTKEIEDQYGGKKKVFQIFDSNTGKLKDIEANSATDAQAKASGGDDSAVPGLSDAQKNRVQAIIDGREPYPAQSRARDAQMIRDAVHAADPQFDAVNYNARLKARQSFTSGKDRDNLKSFNTTIGHLEELDKAVGDLHNSNFPAWNKYVANPVAEQFDPKYQASLKRFQAARTAVSDELTRAFRGSGGNVHDIIQWENAINSADSPEALRSAIRTAANLLESRVAAVGDSYNQAMGTTKDPLELLTPHARDAFEKLKAGARGKSGDAAASAAVKPGAYIWDPAKGLVPK